jgi:hypothetical protein
MLYEQSILYFMIRRVMKSSPLKRLTSYLFISFFATILFYLLFSLALKHNKSNLAVLNLLPSPYVVDNFFLGLPCILFFIDLFSAPPRRYDIIQLPMFWIATAFLFYGFMSIPGYILMTYLRHTGNTNFGSVYAINNVLYCLVYLMIGRSFLCKKEKSI